MISRPRRAVTFGLAAAATAVAIVPAAAATKSHKPPAPLTIYPSTTSCPSSGNATYALDTVPGDSANDCLALVIGAGAGPRADEDYVAAPHAKVKLGTSGAITGSIGIDATTFEGNVRFAGYGDVILTMTINGIEVGTVEKSGPITPTTDLAIPVNFAIPKALRGKKIAAMDLLVQWKVPGGFTFVDPDASSLKLPRS